MVPSGPVVQGIKAFVPAIDHDDLDVDVSSTILAQRLNWYLMDMGITVPGKRVADVVAFSRCHDHQRYQLHKGTKVPHVTGQPGLLDVD
jgi:hypothetical protein